MPLDVLPPDALLPEVLLSEYYLLIVRNRTTADSV
jgi:hypothetical protein